MAGTSIESNPTMQSRRRNTTKACEECRRRRSKCDGKTPSCSRCVNRALSCKYSSESDRRQLTSKPYVELLRKRISVLEQALTARSVDIEDVVAHISKDNGLEAGPNRVDVSQTGSLRLSPAKPLAQTERPVSAGEASSGRPDVERTAIEGTLTMEESLNFDQDGEARYFGPSSGRLHFQADGTRNRSPGPSILGSILESSQKSEGVKLRQNQLIQSVMEDSKVSEELQAYLIDLYFTWEQPWCWVVNESLFRESQRNGGKYCSPLLLNCILAIASRFTDRVDVRSDPSDPNTAGKLFLDNAEVILHYDLKWPTITTIQALSIMGTIYVAQGADAAGWLHQGMANRLAIDMGLNLDADSLRRDNTMSPDEVDLRRQIYWALYCVDKLSAAYTGRVCTFLDSQGVVKLPNIERSNKGREDIWSFKTDEEHSLFTVRTSFASLHYAIITLCQILEKILLALYAPKPACSGQKRATFLISCASELNQWYSDLPPEVCIDTTAFPIRIPHVFTMHMAYHTAIILLYKPFLNESRQSDLDENQTQHMTGEPTSDPIVLKANIACYEAAKAICAASNKYRQMFGSFRRSPLTATHCNLMAALIFLQTQTEGAGKKKTPFDTCAKVLQELSESWNPAGRLLQNILRLQRPDLGSKIPARDDAQGDNSGPTQSSQSKEPSETQSHIICDTASNKIHHTLATSQSALMDFGLGDWGTDADMAIAPYLVSDDLSFTFDSLPGDYSAFNYINIR